MLLEARRPGQCGFRSGCFALRFTFGVARGATGNAAAATSARQTVQPEAGLVGGELTEHLVTALLEAYAQPGVDIISIGGLTHSAPASDISFLLEVA